MNSFLTVHYDSFQLALVRWCQCVWFFNVFPSDSDEMLTDLSSTVWVRCYWFTKVLCCISHRGILPEHQHIAFKGMLHKYKCPSSHLVACCNLQHNPNPSALFGLVLVGSQEPLNPLHMLCLKGRKWGFGEESYSQKWRARRLTGLK